MLSRNTDQIESDVRSQSSEIRVATTMLDMLLPHAQRSSILPADPSSIDESYITTKILPTISITGTVLDSLGNVGPDSRRDRLQRVSALLRENRDTSAEEILNGLNKDIAESPAQIQAAYHNSKGILALPPPPA